MSPGPFGHQNSLGIYCTFANYFSGVPTSLKFEATWRSVCVKLRDTLRGSKVTKSRQVCVKTETATPRYRQMCPFDFPSTSHPKRVPHQRKASRFSLQRPQQGYPVQKNKAKQATQLYIYIYMKKKEQYSRPIAEPAICTSADPGLGSRKMSRGRPWFCFRVGLVKRNTTGRKHKEMGLPRF